METERAKRLAGFVSWVGANIKGYEKGEAQLFLDRFFQAFGHAGVKEAGATLEEPVKKGGGKAVEQITGMAERQPSLLLRLVGDPEAGDGETDGGFGEVAGARSTIASVAIRLLFAFLFLIFLI